MVDHGGRSVAVMAMLVTFLAPMAHPGMLVDAKSIGGGNAGASKPGPVHNPGNDKFKSLGCWTEGVKARALPKLVLTGNDMTIDKCLAACSAYKYAGAQYSDECFCGDVLDASSKQAKLTDCNVPCKGNSAEYCGGGNGNRLHLYIASSVGQTGNTQNTPAGQTGNTHNTPAGQTGNAQNPPAGQTGNAQNPPAGQTGNAHIIYPNITKASASASNSVNATLTHLPSMTPHNSANATKASHLPSNSMNATSNHLPSMTPHNYMNATKASHLPSNSANVTSNHLPSMTPHNSMNATKASHLPSNSMNATHPHTALASASHSISNSMNATWNAHLATAPIAKASHAPSNSMNSSSQAQPTSHPGAQTTASGSISPSANATSPSTWTTGSPASGDGWVYKGCAKQTHPLALIGASRIGKMTIEKCQKYCLNKNFPVAGLENGDTCYCGSALQSGSKLGYEGCNKKCDGNKDQICGGVDRLSVYDYTLEFAPVVVRRVGSYLNQGCFAPPPKGKTLSKYSFSDDKMTAEFCVEACQAKGYSWAALEGGRDCHCDHAINPSASHAQRRNCRTPCAGDGRQLCGGTSHLQVYHN